MHKCRIKFNFVFVFRKRFLFCHFANTEINLMVKGYFEIDMMTDTIYEPIVNCFLCVLFRSFYFN